MTYSGTRNTKKSYKDYCTSSTRITNSCIITVVLRVLSTQLSIMRSLSVLLTNNYARCIMYICYNLYSLKEQDDTN